MNIRDAQGGLPTTAIGVSSQASYQVVELPPRPGAVRWSITGNDPGAVIQGARDGIQVTVAALHGSAAVDDIQLVATFTPQDGSPPTVSTLPLTVFAAEIRDAANAPTPTLDVGIGNQTGYRPVVVPALPNWTGYWQVGSNGRIAITNQWPTGEIRVTGQSVSPQGRDGTLTLVMQIGVQQATASVNIGVFDVRVRLDRYTGWVGVGEVVTCSAEVVPPDVIPPSGGAAWRWSVSPHFQLMGDANASMASIVANAASGNVDQDWVEVAVTWRGSTVRARLALTAIGVWIRDSEQGDPPTQVGVGASVRYRAVVEPALEEVLALWQSGDTVLVEQSGLDARVTGVRASAYAGADGLAVYVITGGAMTRALIPLTVVAQSIQVTG